MAQSLILSRRDLDFLLHEWLGVDDRETVDAVLDLAEDIATETFAPGNRLGDSQEPFIGDDGKVVLPEHVRPAIEACAKAGFLSAGFGEELGGSNLPTSVHRAAMAWFQAANISISAYLGLTMANAGLLVAYGTKEQIATWVPPLLDGRYLGTMCLSETQAGSSLADITTRAELQEDGTYRITGTKMWISGGDHELTENIVHLVLAKIPGGPPGVKGISLFIVPKYREDGSRNAVSLTGLNHKMGYRGTTNALLDFEGATGTLVGEAHAGLSYMFHMMNEARIGVGLGATALGYTGYLHSVRYARERSQGRPLAGKDPSAPAVPIIEHTDVRRMLLAQKSYVEGALALGLYCSHLVDQAASSTDAAAVSQAELLLDVLTPIAKSWPSQWCLEANALAIQVHGGYGYTRDFPVEQFYRDNRLNPIHEGTHGVQGLDLLGRKVTMKGGAGLLLLIAAARETIARASAAGGEASSIGVVLGRSLERLGTVTPSLFASGSPEVALANSTYYLEATGHVVLAWMWLEQYLAAGESSGDFYEGKRQATRYFFNVELPKTNAAFDLLETNDQTSREMDPAWF